MDPYLNRNGSRKRMYANQHAEGRIGLKGICNNLRLKEEQRKREEEDGFEQAKKASLADLAACIAKPGSQLEAELRQDTYNTVPPQGGVEQDSGTSLPDAPGLPAQNKNLIDPSDDHEMPPLILDDDEEFPSVKEILYRTTSNIDPKRTKHIIVDPTKINNPVAAQASQANDPSNEDMTRRPKTYKASPGSIYQPPADPKGYPPTDCDPNKPFRLLDCEDEVRQRILQHILTEPDPITPYYYEGCVEGTDEETQRENFPIPMLVALAGKDNKKHYGEARDIFYGWNKWKFTDPKVSLWWLKHINSNVKSLRDIEILLSQGECRNGTRKEKLWWNLLAWLKSRHSLKTVRVSFEKWDNRLVEGEHPSQYPPVRDTRIGVIMTLLAFRGLKWATVVPGDYVWVHDITLTEKAMILRQGEYDFHVEIRDRELKPAPVKKWSFR